MSEPCPVQGCGAPLQYTNPDRACCPYGHVLAMPARQRIDEARRG
jgi:hypothetical protein